MVLCLCSSQSKSSVRAALYAHLFLLGQGETTNRTGRKIPNQKYTTWWLSTEAATLTVDLKGGITLSASTLFVFISQMERWVVKSKETVGNSWTVLKVILGHKYHHNQSLNEVRMYHLQPKSATKGDFFHIFLSLIVSTVGVTDCKLQTKPTKCC